MNRQEHIQWCKDRALEYVELGDLTNAVASMSSDIEKHDETKGHSGALLGVMELLGSPSQESIKRWINGFN